MVVVVVAVIVVGHTGTHCSSLLQTGYVVRVAWHRMVCHALFVCVIDFTDIYCASRSSASRRRCLSLCIQTATTPSTTVARDPAGGRPLTRACCMVLKHARARVTQSFDRSSNLYFRICWVF